MANVYSLYDKIDVQITEVPAHKKLTFWNQDVQFLLFDTKFQIEPVSFLHVNKKLSFMW